MELLIDAWLVSAVVGRAAFLRGMRHYSETWRYRHPYPEDFYAAFQKGAGVDIGWYFEEVFQGTGRVDWSVEVDDWKLPELSGYEQVEDGSFVLRESDEEAGGAENGSPPGDEDDEDDGRPRKYEVVVRRKGSLRLPLTIEVSFDDESKKTFQWTRAMQAESTWWRLPLQAGTTKVTSVVIDPQQLYYLDGNMADNRWYADTDPMVPARWAERVYTQYAHLLHWFCSMGG